MDLIDSIGKIFGEDKIVAINNGEIYSTYYRFSPRNMLPVFKYNSFLSPFYDFLKENLFNIEFVSLAYARNRKKIFWVGNLKNLFLLNKLNLGVDKESFSGMIGIDIYKNGLYDVKFYKFDYNSPLKLSFEKKYKCKIMYCTYVNTINLHRYKVDFLIKSIAMNSVLFKIGESVLKEKVEPYGVSIHSDGNKVYYYRVFDWK